MNQKNAAEQGTPRSFIRDFLQQESSAGILLMGVAALALLVANSPLGPAYFEIQHATVGGLSVLHWINDALMALFFLLVGLEIKRELLEGQLSSWPQRVLPGVAALGGMAVPALIYVCFSQGKAEALRGWAVPMATDIAFALGVLALLGPRVPASLKIFLTALAIIDDLGAVVVIALFYTSELSLPFLGLAAVAILVLVAMNLLGIKRLSLYLAVGAVLWFFVLKSGIHATLAGVALALTIPLRSSGSSAEANSAPLLRLEHGLHYWVAFLIIPIFGFANAGVAFTGMSPRDLLEPVPLGIAAGLFAGKQIGVFGFCWLAIRSGLAQLPADSSWLQLYGIALLCGIGFTMSLFIGALGFAGLPHLADETKVGVLAGSVLSALAGAVLLRWTVRRLG
ncbi:Na+/H+ antiporter NhaA [Hydrocarboniphaga sp.]|uniref:Na+/H+ antiporter NhaA n=1 Tax=Hydrocarboniphaga sp. TaxID=2033016 RepID=UPI002612F834|nr:Na+/H+ antiporter NhaA [Hydrocarboniphaga sp.]